MPHLLCFPTDGHQCSVCRWNYRNETRQLVWIEQADRQSPASALPAWACFETSFSSVWSIQMSIQRELVLKQADRWAPPWNRSPVEFQLITVPSCRHILWLFNAFLLHRVEVQTDFTNCNRIWWPMWQFLRCLHREAAITQLCVHIVDWWKYNAVNVSSYQRQQTDDWGLQTLQLLSQDTSHWNLFDCLLRAVCWPSGQLESVELGFRWVRLRSLVRMTRWQVVIVNWYRSNLTEIFDFWRQRFNRLIKSNQMGP